MFYSKNQLERYKDKDFVQAQFEEITRDVPAFKKIFHVFVDERDKCLAYSLQECVRNSEFIIFFNIFIDTHFFKCN